MKNHKILCDHGALQRSCGICERDKRITELENCIRQILKTDDKHGKRVRFDHARLCLNGPMICGEG